MDDEVIEMSYTVISEHPQRDRSRNLLQCAEIAPGAGPSFVDLPKVEHTFRSGDTLTFVHRYIWDTRAGAHLHPIVGIRINDGPLIRLRYDTRFELDDAARR